MIKSTECQHLQLCHFSASKFLLICNRSPPPPAKLKLCLDNWKNCCKIFANVLTSAFSESIFLHPLSLKLNYFNLRDLQRWCLYYNPNLTQICLTHHFCCHHHCHDGTWLGQNGAWSNSQFVFALSINVKDLKYLLIRVFLFPVSICFDGKSRDGRSQ